MADQNPKGGGQAMPLDLPASHLKILSDLLACWLVGAKCDLRRSERLKDPERARRDADAFERLLAGVERGEIVVPDESARCALAAATEGNDHGTEYTQVVAEHDALHGLLGILEGPTA